MSCVIPKPVGDKYFRRAVYFHKTDFSIISSPRITLALNLLASFEFIFRKTAHAIQHQWYSQIVSIIMIIKHERGFFLIRFLNNENSLRARVIHLH